MSRKAPLTMEADEIRHIGADSLHDRPCGGLAQTNARALELELYVVGLRDHIPDHRLHKVDDCTVVYLAWSANGS